MDEIQINEDSKAYCLILAGGMGARILQTSYIRSLIRMRTSEKTSYPILVIDNSIIGNLIGNSFTDKNIKTIRVPEFQQHWPQDPGYRTLADGTTEHAMFTDWRTNFSQYKQEGAGSFHNLIKNNMERTYQIEYGYNLTSLIHEHKLKDKKESFICYLYSKSMREDKRLDYDGKGPMIKRTENNSDLEKFLDSQNKPIVLLHLGVDRNPQDMMSPINYRIHKVWSLQRWAEVAQNLSSNYSVIQVHANQYNPQIPEIGTVKVDNLNPVLQIMEHPQFKFFMSIDNYLPHLAAGLNKSGIVLWGSVSPYIWGHKHNINVWNKHSCAEIACWRPGMFDVDNNGLTFVCPHYNCMRSITTKQVLENVEKMEEQLKNNKSNLITL
jgi:ADP-heptose:LPS heptosyltransferase